MSMKEKIEIHKLFWCKSNSKPLLYVANYSPLQRDEKIPLTDGHLISDGAYLHPDLIDPQALRRKIKG